MIRLQQAGQSAIAVTVISLSITLAVLAGLYVRSGFADAETTRPPLTVATHYVNRSQDLVIDHWFSGRVEPRQRLQLASELAGKIDTVRVDEGDSVQIGDILLELDTSILQAERKRLHARLARIKAETELEARRLKRQKDLKIQGFSAIDTIDGIETSLKLFAAERADVLAQVERIEIQLGKSVVRAPFNALVQSRRIDVGAVVSAGTPLIELLEAGVGEVKVGVPVAIARAVKQGEVRRVQVNNEETSATVLSVAPAVDPVTQTVAVRLELKGTQFRFGEYANLHFETTESNEGFWIPNAALVENERGLWSVFAIDEGKRITSYTATILHADNRRAFVDIARTDGLHIVVSGLNRVSPGMVVTH